jgi:uncharacterized protein
MLIQLHEITGEGLDLSFDLSGEWARQALAGTEADGATARVQATAYLCRTNRSVFARGRLVGAMTLPCSRCTGPAAFPFDVPYQVTFLPRPDEDDLGADEEGSPEEVELAAEDLDLATYTNDEIDLDSLLREQLLLVIPMAHLCREDCKGLCPQCGKDLNEGPCDCPPAPADDRWAALKNVKL